MKRRIKLAAGVAVLAMAMSACSSVGQKADAASTIELWTSWSEGESTSQALEPMIKAWAEANDYTIKQSNFTYDQIREKLVASAAGDNLPDVVWGLPEYLGEFNKLGILADLSEAWNSWEHADKVSDSLKASMMVDGKIVGFPYEATARAYLVHDDMLSAAGVEPPTTWDEVLTAGEAYAKAGDGSMYGVTGTGVRAAQELIVYLAQKDLEIATPQEGGGYKNTWGENPEQLQAAAEVFQFYKDVIDSGAANANSATYGWESTDENFATGLTATFVVGNWLAEREETNPETMGDVSVHPIPIPEGGKAATYIESKPIFVMEGTESLEASTALAMEFASPAFQEAAFADRSALSTVSTDSKWSKDFSALMEDGITYPPVALGEVTQNMVDSIAMVLQNGDSPEAAAQWLGESINESLKNSGDLATS